MKLGFRERPYDLVLVALSMVAFSAIAVFRVAGIAGIVVGVLLVLFFPGYALVAALFPAEGEISWLQRLTLSIAVSLAIVPLAGLLANLTPWGIRVEPVLAILDVGAIAGCAVAYVRRLRLNPDRRLGLYLEPAVPRWSGFSTAERTLVVALVLLLVLASVAVTYSMTQATGPPEFVEFYLLNESGEPTGYPTDLRVNENASVILVAISHESSVMNYAVEVRLTTLLVSVNRTTGRNETVEVSNATLSVLPLPLPPQSEARIPYPFSINQTGTYYLKFLLYRGSLAGEPYRFVRLRIQVT